MSTLVTNAVVSQKAPSCQGGSDQSGIGEEGRVRRGGRWQVFRKWCLSVLGAVCAEMSMRVLS